MFSCDNEDFRGHSVYEYRVFHYYMLCFTRWFLDIKISNPWDLPWIFITMRKCQLLRSYALKQTIWQAFCLHCLVIIQVHLTLNLCWCLEYLTVLIQMCSTVTQANINTFGVSAKQSKLGKAHYILIQYGK
jgi:hypothetical protein